MSHNHNQDSYSKPDLLINQLKENLSEIEQNNKNFKKLNQKLKNLQNEYFNLREEKKNLELDFNIKSDSADKQIVEVKSDLENFNLILNEKINNNQKLYEDYENLINNLQSKINEMNILKLRLNDSVKENSQIEEEKNELEILVKELKENTKLTKNEYDRIREDNERIYNTCMKEEELIRKLEIERNKYLELNENIKFENLNMNNKIKMTDENLNINQKELNESNKIIMNLSNHIKELEIESENLHQELDSQENRNQKEIKMRLGKEKEFEELEKSILEKEKEMKKNLLDLDNLIEEKDKLYEDNLRLHNEIDRLKNHLYIIMGQNKKVKIIFLNILF